MRKPVVISAKEAVNMIQDNTTLGIIAMTQVSASTAILKEIEKSFMENGHPRALTYLHTCGQASAGQPGGMQYIAHEGLLKRVIGGHWGQSSNMMNLIKENKIEAFNLPQGQMANMFHSMALREPGKLSKVGLGTYIDPRIEGGKMNQCAKDSGYDTVAIVTVDGEEYIQYKPVPIDTLLIRGTYADENGNISTEREAMVLEILPAVMATKRWGGKVICQVERIVKNGSIGPKDVIVPGVLVDAVVVCEHPYEDHRQTYSWYYDPTYTGEVLAPEGDLEILPTDMRKIISRRAVAELVPDMIINIGTGIPNENFGPIIAEENLSDIVTITVESGVYGGVPAGTIDFGISQNAQALIPHDRQFELYNGTGIDFTFMGAGEMDKDGNINATKMGSKAPGAGGFIDITATAKNIIFCSSFTGGGLKTSFSDEGIKIEQEGKFKKLVQKVQQISYNGKLAYERGQNMVYITERAVFKLTENGIMLVEIAKGVDLQKDILDQMEFVPLIAEKLKITDTNFYKEGACDLRSIIERNI
ncbi:MAG: acyl CoA:acetate/3-ketoacid CoA transferase [Lachnospiraceae bacterium]|nr:acyl CoA:acetate/3-ketoacid CoA transferase [Lachnospiraceae bacterium]MDD3617006.1 acyl CoA:acetate/3-ketoacid CoA transferase [Lachnospiraceae bacterium]